MPIDPPPPPGHVVFFLISCSISTLLTAVETAASFPSEGVHPARILLNFWALLLYGFYATTTLAVGLVLWERGVLDFTWTWAFGLGFCVPWAMQTGVTLFQPLDGKAKEFALSLKNVTSRLKTSAI